MIFHRELAIGTFQRRFVGAAIDPEGLVKIWFRQGLTPLFQRTHRPLSVPMRIR
jgi:hypothetical protein